ncbi:hypothetical protein RYX38_10870 [Lacticaseibacillus rhamnosus]|nr:hypothetical protein [Lacticaseibacillus rhamnosus]
MAVVFLVAVFLVAAFDSVAALVEAAAVVFFVVLLTSVAVFYQPLKFLP